MKTFKFPLVLRTRENTNVFITLDENIYGIHSKRVNILYLLHFSSQYTCSLGDMLVFKLHIFSLSFSPLNARKTTFVTSYVLSGT